MKLSTLAPLAAFGVLFVVGCGKSEKSQTSTTGATTPGESSACATKLTTLKKGAPATDSEKKVYATVCEQISAPARDCIAAAKDDKAMDTCVTTKEDKEKLFVAILGAAMAEDKTLGNSAKAGAAGGAGTTGTSKLDKLGLAIDVPGEVMVNDGIGKKDLMLMGEKIGGMTVGEANAHTAKTLKAAKSESQLFKPKNVLGEQTADGYWLTFENTGSLGTNYWVKTLKKVNGKSYECSGTSDTAEKANAVLAACKTLR